MSHTFCTKSALGALAFVTLLGTTACGATSFEGAKPSEKSQLNSKAAGAPGSEKFPGQSNAQGELTLACASENAMEPSHVQKSDGSPLKIALPAVCSQNSHSRQSIATKKPTDVIFVLDVTGSMQDSINTLKNHIATFANSLETRGFDARFAAYGFRDRGQTRHKALEQTGSLQSPFVSSAQLKTQLGTWKAQGGGDLAEDGQWALSQAITALQDDAGKTPGRAGADKVILYVSDAPAKTIQQAASREEYDHAALLAQLKSAKAKFAGLKLFHSTPSMAELMAAPKGDFTVDVKDEGFEDEEDLFLAGEEFSGIPAGVSPRRKPMLEPKVQMESIRNASGLPGKALPFPFTQQVFLDQFSESFVESVSEKSERCFVTKVTSQGQELLSKSAGELEESQSVALSPLSVGKNETERTLEITRCCVSADSTGSKSCSREAKSSVKIVIAK